MAYLRQLPSRVDAVTCAMPHPHRPVRARFELLSYAAEHAGYSCVSHAAEVLQRQRDIEADALLNPWPPLSIVEQEPGAG